MLTNTRLTLAIQKKGRLSDDSLDLLERCGLKLLSSKSSLFYSVTNFPVDLLMVRDDDIPTLIQSGVCDLGIVGDNVLQERECAQGSSLEKIKALSFACCRLSIAVPKEMPFTGIRQLHNKRIATSYPYLLRNYLKNKNLQAEIVEISGSVEIAPRLGMSDAICDLVSTGKTLEENNLSEVAVVFESQAVLVKDQKPLDPNKQMIVDRLLKRIEGVFQAQESKYILFHAPKNAISLIEKLLPCSEKPTIMSLAGCEDKVAVHVVSREAVFWGTLEKLRDAGASSILVLPVEKMLF